MNIEGSLTNAPNADLVAMCKTGDDYAWNVLIKRFRRMIYHVCFQHGIGATLADDLFQDVSIKLFEHIGSIRDGAYISNWLYMTTKRECLTWANRLQRDVEFEPKKHDMAVDVIGRLEEDETQATRDREVQQAVQKLSERDRAVLDAVFIRKIGYDEVSRSLNMPIGSVGPTRRRACERLLEVLRKSGFCKRHGYAAAPERERYIQVCPRPKKPRPVMGLSDGTITVRQAAEMAGIEPVTIYRMIREGRLPSEKLGRRVLIDSGALQNVTIATKARRVRSRYAN
jgi:RNA polymerase sigma factor (sigma-70 family)